MVPLFFPALHFLHSFETWYIDATRECHLPPGTVELNAFGEMTVHDIQRVRCLMEESVFRID